MLASGQHQTDSPDAPPQAAPSVELAHGVYRARRGRSRCRRRTSVRAEACPSSPTCRHAASSHRPRRPGPGRGWDGWPATTTRSSSTPSWPRWRRRAASARAAGWVPRSCWRASAGAAGGRGAALPQDQQLRRVHLRLGLGQRRHARRAALLPQAGRRHAVHAGDRAAAAAAGGARRRRGRRRRPRCCAGCARWPTTSAPRRCTCCSAPSRRSSCWRRHGYAPRLSACSSTGTTAPAALRDFDDYLATFRRATASRCARSARRRPGTGCGFRTATGPELDAADWAALRAFYLANIERHGGIAYLTDAFFDVARDDAGAAGGRDAGLSRATKPVAGTLNFEKGAHLYGRYWGCLDDLQMLHFELCYYRLIERAIERALHAVRGRRAGRAQAEARPGAGVHPQRALDPPRGAGRRRARLRPVRGGRRRRARRPSTPATRRFAPAATRTPPTRMTARTATTAPR